MVSMSTSKQIRESLLAGCIVALFGAGCAFWIAGPFAVDRARFVEFVFPAGIAAGLAGAGAWWWLVAHRSVLSRWRAIIAGAIAGTAAHPVFWAIVLPFSVDVRNPIEFIALGAYLSLLITGVFTIPIGAVAGWVSFLIVRRMRAQPIRGDEPRNRSLADDRSES